MSVLLLEHSLGIYLAIHSCQNVSCPNACIFFLFTLTGEGKWQKYTPNAYTRVLNMISFLKAHFLCALKLSFSMFCSI